MSLYSPGCIFSPNLKNIDLCLNKSSLLPKEPKLLNNLNKNLRSLRLKFLNFVGVANETSPSDIATAILKTSVYVFIYLFIIRVAYGL